MQRYSKELFLAAYGCVGVYEAPELVSKRNHVRDARFEVKIKTVNGGRAKGAVGNKARSLQPKNGLDVVGCVNGKGRI